MKPLYIDTVTIFNCKEISHTEGSIYYPTVIRNVNLNIDRAAILAKYGPETNDTAMLAIRFKPSAGEALIDCGNDIQKPWMPPKSWDGTVDSLTFNPSGDFFWMGEWKGGICSDEEYPMSGFFGYMNQNHDNVFVISSVAKYDLIPHFEIMGR